MNHRRSGAPTRAPLGVNYRGHIVNREVSRYQRCVSNLYHAGVLQKMLDADSREVVVEVGGGFGGLSNGLTGIFGGKATYFLIDLPELLFIQGVYLALNNPDATFHVHQGGGLDSSVLEHTFVLVPHTKAHVLSELPSIDLFINMQSFQEMTEEQVHAYASLAGSKLRGWLYSDNVDRHPRSTELSSVTAILAAHLDLYPEPGFYDALLKGSADWNLSYRKYIGVPKGSSGVIWQRIVGLPKRSFKRNIARMLPPVVRRNLARLANA